MLRTIKAGLIAFLILKYQVLAKYFFPQVFALLKPGIFLFLFIAISGTLRFFTSKIASNQVLVREIPHSAKNS